MRLRKPGFAARSAAFFLVATAVMTWPMAVSPRAHVSARQDFFLGLWDLEWVADVLARPSLALLSTERLYFPVGTGLEAQPLTLLQTVAAAPLTLSLGPAVTYNLLVLTSFWAAGWLASLWVRDLTGSAPAGIVAGVAFAFSPYHYTYLGQLNLLQIGVVPLYFLAELALRRRATPTRAALAGAALAAVGLTSWYYGVGVGLAALVLSAARLARGSAGAGRRLALEAVHWGTCALLVGPLVLRLSPGFGVSAARAVEFPGLGLVMESFKESGVTVALHSFAGLAVLALAALGCVSWRRAAPLAALAAGFLLLSLGSRASLWGSELTLPYAWLEGLPVVGALRFPDRFFVLVQLGLAALAGLGVQRLLAGRGARARGPLAAALVLLVLGEYWPGPLPVSTPPASLPIPAADTGSPGALFHVPAWFRNLDGESMFHQLAHGRPIPGGYLTRRNGKALRRLHARPPVATLLGPPPSELPAGLARGLREQGFAYVCIQRRSSVRPLEAQAGRPILGPWSLGCRAFLARRLFPAYPERDVLAADADAWARLLSTGWGPPAAETPEAAVFEIPGG